MTDKRIATKGKSLCNKIKAHIGAPPYLSAPHTPASEILI